MNNRIIEIAKQCGMHFGRDDVGHNAFVTFPGRHEEGVELAKFAELVVLECSQFLKDTLDDHFAAEQIEEHFGVHE